MLSVVMLSVIMLSVVMLSAVMLNVVAPPTPRSKKANRSMFIEKASTPNCKEHCQLTHLASKIGRLAVPPGAIVLKLITAVIYGFSY